MKKLIVILILALSLVGCEEIFTRTDYEAVLEWCDSLGYTNISQLEIEGYTYYKIEKDGKIFITRITVTGGYLDFYKMTEVH